MTYGYLLGHPAIVPRGGIEYPNRRPLNDAVIHYWVGIDRLQPLDTASSLSSQLASSASVWIRERISEQTCCQPVGTTQLQSHGDDVDVRKASARSHDGLLAIPMDPATFDQHGWVIWGVNATLNLAMLRLVVQLGRAARPLDGDSSLSASEWTLAFWWPREPVRRYQSAIHLNVVVDSLARHLSMHMAIMFEEGSLKIRDPSSDGVVPVGRRGKCWLFSAKESQAWRQHTGLGLHWLRSFDFPTHSLKWESLSGQLILIMHVQFSKCTFNRSAHLHSTQQRISCFSAYRCQLPCHNMLCLPVFCIADGIQIVALFILLY